MVELFSKTNGNEHCFLAPAKSPRSAISNNFINKIITGIQKSLLVAAEPTRKWRHTVKMCL